MSKEINPSEERLLQLVGITYNQIESGVYALILGEVDGNRRIPIVIGYPEAQAIECKLQEIITPRPLTHDLMTVMLHSLGATLQKIVIRKLPSGVFAAYIHLLTLSGEQIQLDARSSDAIAVAIRVNAPIYTTEALLQEVGFVAERRHNAEQRVAPPVAEVSESHENVSPLDGRSYKELLDMMQRSVEKENYERAAEIKKYIDSHFPEAQSD